MLCHKSYGHMHETGKKQQMKPITWQNKTLKQWRESNKSLVALQRHLKWILKSHLVKTRTEVQEGRELHVSRMSVGLEIFSWIAWNVGWLESSTSKTAWELNLIGSAHEVVKSKWLYEKGSPIVVHYKYSWGQENVAPHAVWACRCIIAGCHLHKNWQSSNCQDMGSKISHLKEYDGTNILLRNTSDLEIGRKTSGKEPQNEQLLFIHSDLSFGWWGLPLHSVKSMYVCTWDELSRFCRWEFYILNFWWL